MAPLYINSLSAHIDQFRIFMNESDIDVIPVNETKLDSSIGDNKVYILGFEIVRKDNRWETWVVVFISV